MHIHSKAWLCSSNRVCRLTVLLAAERTLTANEIKEIKVECLLSYFNVIIKFFKKRMRGIEPLALAWKAKVLPLYDIRSR